MIALLMLGFMFAAAWFYDPRESISASGEKVAVADGDSFTIGASKLRLHGIDAPEYRQTCRDAEGVEWQCGKAARAALEKRLLEPGLVCKAQAKDKYGRALATCSTRQTADVAAAQVRDGMAISHEYLGVRDYPDEEDAARAAKKGIWIGAFERPEDWRAQKRIVTE
ncbi:thermonuclease family protein [Sphingorhabdus sp.]|uniref:thermonuclease family protein n=1 Tax=Sphingorhabdus sp. TaxID=1902408 RepID=UPI002CB7C052|nr:thermonuclease family protein [Sphingorhabdus sp.]HMT40111.1 thermonuclease family protein [Sphingorhabdus sp.]